MIFYKTREEIERIRISSLLVGKTLAEVAKSIKPGVSTLDLDKVAEEFIKDHGAVPGFLGYGGFPNSLCTSVNEAVVHGIPNNKPLVNGSIVFDISFNSDIASKKLSYSIASSVLYFLL